MTRRPLVMDIDIRHAQARLAMLRDLIADAIREHGHGSPEFELLSDEYDAVDYFLVEYGRVR